MNVQTEKLQLIEWLVQLQDVSILQRMIQLKEDAEVLAYEASLRPMTVAELIERAEESNRDIAAGRVYDIDDVIREESEQ